MRVTVQREGQVMADVNTMEWDSDGHTLTRGSKHFGAWWVAQAAELTDSGVEIGAAEFYGSIRTFGRPEDVAVQGIEAARQFARELLAAADYAEAVGMH